MGLDEGELGWNVVLRCSPGVTVFGYPAGRNIAEMLRPRACKGFSLKSRFREVSVVRAVCCEDVG